MKERDEPFLSYIMGEGEGQRNLGKQMSLSEDVYAVLFCGLIKHEYIDYCDAKKEREEAGQG